MLTAQRAAAALAKGPSIVEGLIAAAPPEALTFREADGAWTCLEVVAHLADGEITNWMPRIDCILAGGGPFSPFDREAGFARYRDWPPDALVREFADLRRTNLDTLSRLDLTDADLMRTGTHPAFGTVTLGQLLATWTTHDMAHVSQISRVLTRALGRHVGPWAQYFSLLAATPRF